MVKYHYLNQKNEDRKEELLYQNFVRSDFSYLPLVWDSVSVKSMGK